MNSLYLHINFNRVLSRTLTALAVVLLGILPVMAQDSDGVFNKEPEEDLHALLLESAEAGDVEAMNYLGYLLLSGEEGMDRDQAAGLLWLIRAASLGDAKAASNLGWLYVKGELVEQDLQEGVKWLDKAAGKGLPVAQSLLGDLFRDGMGVEKDTLAADSLYRQAFEHGLYDAGYKLYALNADAYERLSPEEKVNTGKYYYLRGAPSEGVKLFYMASDEGNAEAMALLGDAYARAIGVPYDHDLSLKYYVEAATRGNPSAQFVLGELLEIFPDALQGYSMEGVSDNPAYWYAKAAEAGVTDASIATERLLFPVSAVGANPF